MHTELMFDTDTEIGALNIVLPNCDDTVIGAVLDLTDVPAPANRCFLRQDASTVLNDFLSPVSDGGTMTVNDAKSDKLVSRLISGKKFEYELLGTRLYPNDYSKVIDCTVVVWQTNQFIPSKLEFKGATADLFWECVRKESNVTKTSVAMAQADLAKTLLNKPWDAGNYLICSQCTSESDPTIRQILVGGMQVDLIIPTKQSRVLQPYRDSFEVVIKTNFGSDEIIHHSKGDYHRLEYWTRELDKHVEKVRNGPGLSDLWRLYRTILNG